MQWLAALCVRRPVFASVLILSLTVIGIFSFAQLGIDQFPSVDFPVILVTTRLPGAAPEQVETEVTDKVEEAVNTISGIDTLTSPAWSCGAGSTPRTYYVRCWDSRTARERSMSCSTPIAANRTNTPLRPARALVRVITHLYLAGASMREPCPGR